MFPRPAPGQNRGLLPRGVAGGRGGGGDDVRGDAIHLPPHPRRAQRPARRPAQLIRVGGAYRMPAVGREIGHRPLFLTRMWYGFQDDTRWIKLKLLLLVLVLMLVAWLEPR